MGLAMIFALAGIMVVIALFLGSVAAIAVEQHRLQQAERKQLEDTLKHMELLK